MPTIFEQALKELDEVKRGLSTANAKLFAQTISAAEKAEDALKTFQSAASAAESHIADMLKVQAILSGKPATITRTRTAKKRDPNAAVTVWHAPKGVTHTTMEWRSDKRGAGPSWYREAKKNGTLDRLMK
jgi:hypothetical protein